MQPSHYSRIHKSRPAHPGGYWIWEASEIWNKEFPGK